MASHLRPLLASRAGANLTIFLSKRQTPLALNHPSRPSPVQWTRGLSSQVAYQAPASAPSQNHDAGVKQQQQEFYDQQHQQQQQQPPSPGPNPFKPFRVPFIKIFLMGLLTYQFSYWCWEKMRVLEWMEETEAEVKALEDELQPYRKDGAQNKNNGR